jgi:Ca2+-binding RTX toxin-like protein
MKRVILTAMTVLVACAAPTAHAAEPSLTVLLAGGSEDNVISIKLSSDGRTYVIDTLGQPLEVGGSICAHPQGNESELLCEAASIAGFEVNAGGGNDSVMVAAVVPIAVTLRGGPGEDRLLGGAGADKLVGGSGNDDLIGRGGDDSIFGGPGDDRLVGGWGDDLLRGGSGEDVLIGSAGHNDLIQ